MPLFSSKSVSEGDLVDLHGKVVIVTGGNMGIGYATIQFLARKGAKVYMAARSEERALAAIKQLEGEDIGDGSVHWLRLDLSDPRLGKKAAEEFLQQEARLDILVNNAARSAYGPYHLDKDGLLDIMVTNHITHFAFTEALLPLLKKTSSEEGSDVRIVNVTSVAHDRVSPASFIGKESLNKDFGNSIQGVLDTYGNSKLANILHAKELQRQFINGHIPITCITVHPGAVGTSGFHDFFSGLPSVLKFLVRPILPLFLHPWRYGAMSSAFAAAGSEVWSDRERYKGAHLIPVAQLAQPSKYAMDERLASELYETTIEILKGLGI